MLGEQDFSVKMLPSQIVLSGPYPLRVDLDAPISDQTVLDFYHALISAGRIQPNNHDLNLQIILDLFWSLRNA